MNYLIKYIYPIRWTLVNVFILSLLNVVGALLVPTLTANIINDGVLKGDLLYIESASTSMFGAAALTVIAALSGVFASSHIAAVMGRHMRSDIINSLQQFSLTDFTHFDTGTILMRATRDVEKIQSVLAEGLTLVLPTPLMILVGLGLTFYANWQLGLVILTLMILMLGLMYSIQHKALPIVKAVQLQLDYITDLVRDHILGMAVIRAFNRSHDEHSRESHAFTDTSNQSTQLNRTYAIGLPTILMIFNMSTVVILWIGGYNASEGRLEIGTIMAVIEYATLILLYLIMAIFVLLDIPEVVICYQRITDLLTHYKKQTTSLGEPPEAAPLPQDTDAVIPPLSQDVPLLEFKNVSFRYDNAEVPALEHISFTLNKGEHLAIMGDIGSGKSTITNLIPGLYNASSGDILFNGTSIYNQPIKQIRQRIGYVPQKAYLFTGTVEMNLQYGTDGVSKDVTMADLQEACSLSRADEFISRLDGAYQFEVAQGGINLSGGQRQRLAMARALLRKPDLLIFDDSFSALDGSTEQEVRSNIDAYLRNNPNSAFISVEQKISGARKANKVLVINQGTAVGFGTHEELAQSCDVYQQIIASQEVAL